MQKRPIPKRRTYASVLVALALVGGAIGVTQRNSGEVFVGLGVAIVAAAVLIVLFGAAPNDDDRD